MSDTDKPEIVAGTILPKTSDYSRRLRASDVAYYKGSWSSLEESLSAVSSVSPLAQQTPIRALADPFKKLTAAEIHVFASDDQPIAPRLNVPGVENVPESTLKALAGFEVQRRGRISERTWHIAGGLVLAIVSGVGGWIVARMTGG